MKLKTIATLSIAAAFASPATADEEIANGPRVFADQLSGRCYAKTTPTAPQGQEGSTEVYVLGDSADRLIHTLPWYSQQAYLRCSVGRKQAISVVQMGPWARGRSANENDLALAFYYDGQLVRRYSTLELAGAADNVMASVSHYQVIRAVDGYHERPSDVVFAIETWDGRQLLFDPETGEIVATQRMRVPASDDRALAQ